MRSWLKIPPWLKKVAGCWELAYRFIDDDELDRPKRYEQNLIYLGLTGMIDPVRPEAVEAVRLCKQESVRLTGSPGRNCLAQRNPV